MVNSYLQYITKAISMVKDYEKFVIEATVVNYICEKRNVNFCYNEEFSYLENLVNQELLEKFNDISFPVEIEFVIEFFEALLDKDNITENGIVFTPKYIADYINKNVWDGKENYNNECKTIDPGCGCGIFLISAAEIIKNKFGGSYFDILSQQIYGIDIDEDNVRRCKLVLNLFLVLNGENNEAFNAHVVCADSLKCRWNELFDLDKFDSIIGNPPYVNTHDMTKETAVFLKKTFKTTQNGVYNIFYAFIEHAMEFLGEEGKLSYIIPNNFLTIKAAKELRELIIVNQWMEKIIDFANNMVFKPIRTYNCIIQLSKKDNRVFDYCVMEKNDNIIAALNDLEFNQMEANKLDVNGWKLVDKHTMKNIQKIESQFRSIKEFIRTGIATLRDNIYMVEYDGLNYYKKIDGEKHIIEEELIRRLYKIPDLKQSENIKECCRYIIFPYIKTKGGFEIIEEDELKKKVPLTYEYLLSQKNELDNRDKGKTNPVAWYAYGRTQGLKKCGRKLVFPTFAARPKFTLIEDEEALFCNGYAVFENDYIELELLNRILNSSIMQYYISNTSYMIEGGYYCYQKKYIENFSLPYFTDEEKQRLKNMDDKGLNKFLVNKYEIDI